MATTQKKNGGQRVASGGGKRSDGMPVGGNQDDANYYFNWSDRKNNFSFQLYALDWADNKSILYAPRVTTISNRVARVNISTKRHFTDEWEFIDEEVGDRLRFEGAFMPDLALVRNIGLQPFDVTPQISGENITMTLEPESFAYYSEKADGLEVFPGKYQILYGNSSRDADLKAIDFTVE